MNYRIHRADERGIAEHGWLQSRFSFSFAQYHNPHRMGFGALRVINDDIIAPAQGFGMHPHENMEIITIVINGALEHRDSFGNHDVIHAGEIQYMSAGEGVYHSEFNPSDTEPLSLLQIWIRPHTKGGAPCYVKGALQQHENAWVMLVSGNRDDGGIIIKQDARIYTVALAKECSIAIPSCTQAYGRLVFVVEGSIEMCGERVFKRDEIQILDDQDYTLRAVETSRVIIFEVPLQ